MDNNKKNNEFKIDIYYLKNQVNILLSDLKKEAAWLSNPTNTFENNNYIKIVRMGKDVIPILIEKLKNGGSIYIIDMITDIIGDKTFLKNNKYKTTKEYIDNFIKYMENEYFNNINFEKL